MLAEDFPRNSVEFERRFSTEAACRKYLADQRWPGGYRCPRCDHDQGWPIESRNLIQCASCDHQTSLTAGTLMHGSKKSLTIWFKVIWLFTTNKAGLSAKALQRQLGFSYQTAWCWMQKLRRAMVCEGREPLFGRVEVDVTKLHGEVPKRFPSRLMPVQIAVEDRGKHMGRVRMQALPDESAATLTPSLKEVIEEGATVHTDGWSGYTAVEEAGFVHEVDVIGSDRSASIDMFPLVHRVASLVKRWLLGAYQGAVTSKHLQHYLEEYTFRFNRRSSRHPGKIFMRLVQQAVVTRATTYREIADDKPPYLVAT